jgi:hypothetical protein
VLLVVRALHQEAADPYDVRKLVQVRYHHLLNIGFFCAEWKMIREALHEPRVGELL